MEKLRSNLKKLGVKLPKKHGEWYRLHICKDDFLVLDTWNDQVFHHKECIPSDTNNMYGVVYVFSGYIDTVKPHMTNFWNAQISLL